MYGSVRKHCGNPSQWQYHRETEQASVDSWCRLTSEPITFRWFGEGVSERILLSRDARWDVVVINLVCQSLDPEDLSRRTVSPDVTMGTTSLSVNVSGVLLTPPKKPGSWEEWV